ncbi:MAG: hypothetical protein QFF03_23200 [Pseudomonadota bacterium]|nr:hypothetical protein [Pseudomonadota bacterium]
MGSKRLLAIILATLSSVALAAPRFADYPASSFSGRSANVRLVDPKSRQFATMLRDASRRKPDFAGRYVLASWGCGASCTMTAAIDAKTGAVSWLPFTLCCWRADIVEPLEFRLDSRLLIVQGSRNEQGSGTHYYTFDGRRFSEVRAP